MRSSDDAAGGGGEMMLEVWREACRHIEIRVSTLRIAEILARSSAVRRVIVRRIVLPQSRFETVAIGEAREKGSKAAGRDGGENEAGRWIPEGAGSEEAAKPAGVVSDSRADAVRIAEAEADFGVDGRGAGGARPGPVWSGLSLGEMQIVLEWCARGARLERLSEVSEDVQRAAPKDLHGDALIGPLQGPEAVSGILVLVAADGRRFSATEQRRLAALLEPFSVALENDRRVHEMAVLREAAEAERSALLRRLGRTSGEVRILGAEGGLRHVMERVELISPSNVPVLLLGETGTGKEVVARAIHTHSPRSSGPFIRVNCGAIPPELMDSHLFGHERGSFTGATEARKGWFERADEGTLFLDEVGELPWAAQVRLLRVLQDGHLERVGGQRSLHVDVRIICATNRNLAEMVRANQFRVDLWYRLAVFPIALPPLRDRVEDIGPLAFHFAERAAARFGLPTVMPTPEDLRELVKYDWPGNVRELAAVIDRAALLGNGKRLAIRSAIGGGGSIEIQAPTQFEIPSRTHAESARAPGRTEAYWPSGPAAGKFVERVRTLHEVMREHIVSALRLTEGRIDGRYGCARLLGINPHTLRARMRKLKIDWKKFRKKRSS